MQDGVQTSPGSPASAQDFSCSMTAVLLARARALGGDHAVREVLRQAATERTIEYLSDITNWISYDEAVALWQAGAYVTHHPQFARTVGEDAARRLNGSSVAALLRSLGSPEAVYQQMAMSATKFSTVSELEAVDVGPGYAEIVARSVKSYPRSREHCEWTCGLLTQPTVLFGLTPATIEHEQCAAFGAPCCTYRVTWNVEEAKASLESGPGEEGLRTQLEALKERVQSMFATAADLIGSRDIAHVLARITDRAGLEVRAPRYLLAVRFTPEGEVHTHQKGFAEEEAQSYAERVLEEHPAALPESWLVVPVRSTRREYGRLLAMYENGTRFFPQERELLEVYARYAASALDSATALMEAQQRYDESSALLELARRLTMAGTSHEVAQRLVEAVPAVVDCDRVGVYFWDDEGGALVKGAMHGGEGAARAEEAPDHVPLSDSAGVLGALMHGIKREPTFVPGDTDDPTLRNVLASSGAAALMLVPLATPDGVIGLLSVSVTEGPRRLTPTPDLLNRLSGVAAHATTALQNGRLVDQITHQALHDQLTGLANRLQFNERLRSAIAKAHEQEASVSLFYLDLDEFKPVNDRFGHDVGDELLRIVAERLLACTRKDDLVARLGGDEFVILTAADTSSAESTAFVRRLARAFVEPFKIDERELHVGASIGYGEYPRDADSAESLLRAADSAMFEIKRAQRAGVPRIAEWG